MANELGIGIQELLALGREHADRPEEPFCMPLLALRLAYRSNGVSKLHGEVARGMWQGYWPGVPREEVPISHVTNGIHTRTWMSHDGGPAGPVPRPGGRRPPRTTRGLGQDRGDSRCELWRVHVRRREWMIAAIRRRLRTSSRGAVRRRRKSSAADEMLDPEALTIGFARRFAPYKRATLLFRNLDRLRNIVTNSERPVQFIFAGKAHPHDGAARS
jgi:starch phosphorylase